MAETTRLYFHDPRRLTFAARVLEHSSFAGTPSVVLDQSAFYPESGGQLGDRGTLSGSTVLDVQVTEDGRVQHLLEGELPAVGSEVHGEVDRARRWLHMALHTGQHMLSGALFDVARAETVSSRLGDSACTIDVDREALDEGALARAEALVNSLIEDDLPIRAYFPTAAELEGLALRRKAKVESNVRVVVIGDFDVSPCGGTHCLHTAEVGLLRVTGLERYKGKMRVSFSAGRRAREELFSEGKLLRTLGQQFSCSPGEVPANVAKLRRELTEAREALGEARGRLAEKVGDELVRAAKERSETRVVTAFDAGDVAFLRALAKRITAEALDAFLAVQSEDGQRVLVARGLGSELHAGQVLKALATAAGGQGGGRPELAEGRVPSEVDWCLVARAPEGRTPHS